MPEPNRRAFLASTLAATASAATPSRPNILYLHSHDTGRYLQPYGHNVPAPNIQKLANQGVLFRQCFSAAPTCSPSRAALLTGQSAHQSGMLGLAHRGFSLYDYKQHMLHTLRPAGYKSYLAGVQHIARNPAIIGYDEVLATKSTHVADVVPVAVDFLNRRPKDPFFIEVGFQETHRVFAKPGPAEDPRFCEPPVPVPDTPRSRMDMAAFKATARILDQGVGEVLRALEANGLAENTLVISTTDHGIAFPDMKCSLTDHGIGVHLAMRGPGGFTGGKVIDSMVSHLDLFPTLCDLLDIFKPGWTQGESLLPLIRGEKKELHEELFSEVSYHAAYEPKRACRTARWKYIRNFGDKHTPVLPNCDDGPSKDVWLENGWKNRAVAREELYDLTFDPNERRNIAGEADSAAALTEMRARLDRWMKHTGDPLLKGPVPAPAGATVNDADGISPGERVKPA